MTEFEVVNGDQVAEYLLSGEEFESVFAACMQMAGVQAGELGMEEIDGLLVGFEYSPDDKGELCARLMKEGVEIVEDELDQLEEPEDEEMFKLEGELDKEGELGVDEEEDEGLSFEDDRNIQDTVWEDANIFKAYQSDLGDHRVLEQVEEVEIFKRIGAGRETAASLMVSRRDRRQKQEQIEDGNNAFETIIVFNQRLVISIAKSLAYRRKKLTWMDLIQEGNVGLIRAAKKFDYRRGYKFSTYATWWVRQAMTRAIEDFGRTVRIPVHFATVVNRFQMRWHSEFQRLEREPTVEEMAEAHGISVERAQYINSVSKHCVSLDAPVFGYEDDESSDLGDFIEADLVPLDELAHEVKQREMVLQLLEEALITDDMNEKQRIAGIWRLRVLALRYGLYDGRFRTLQAVGDKMDRSRERVRQIEAKALSILRNSENKHVYWALKELFSSRFVLDDDRRNGDGRE